jgi:hypothetical protein
MSIRNNALPTVEMDFSEIKSSLVDFLKQQDTFKDYNFEGSAMSTLIDVLAYVTHMNAVNAQVGLNETFLDTAQFRGSVVGRARALGYIPKSARAPRASVNISVNTPPNPFDQNYTIPRGFRFTSAASGASFDFVTVEQHKTSTGYFEDVLIHEGVFQTVEYIYDSRSDEKLLIPNIDVDTSTIRVEVADSVNSMNSIRIFTEAKELPSIKAESRVYFLHENPDGFYELTFGDGVLGEALDDGNVIKIEYLVTRKEAGNGASKFVPAQVIENTNNSPLTITVNSPSSGGSSREGKNSIKSLAPITFASQNRAVTPQDYEAIIREQFSNVDSMKVWGGEDNNPPVYGKVFISIKPKSTTFLSNAEKFELLENIIKPKSIVTVTPELVDPTFLYLTIELFFKYDPSLTNLSKVALEKKVLEGIEEYDRTELNRFDRVFRYSKFLKTVDSIDSSILNSFARIYISRRFFPIVNASNQYILDFSTPIWNPVSGSIITRSSKFSVGLVKDCYFKDFVDSDSIRRVSIRRGIGDAEEIIVRNAGVIQGSQIILNEFAPSSFTGNYLFIEVKPNSFDIFGAESMILTMDCNCSRFKIQGDVDTIAIKNDYSGIKYTTPSRDV